MTWLCWLGYLINFVFVREERSRPVKHYMLFKKVMSSLCTVVSELIISVTLQLTLYRLLGIINKMFYWLILMSILWLALA